MKVETSWLIQRAKFEDRDFKKGIDSILVFDYMGSSEFEFGALGKSLKEIRDNINDFKYFEHTFDNGKIITIFGNKNCELDILDNIYKLAMGQIRCKEYTDFNNWVNFDNQKDSFRLLKSDTDFWWDIGNHFMFWSKNEGFEEKFKQMIKSQ